MTPRRARRPHDRGFTLLETLVALATTTIVLGALATAVPTALRARTAATARLERATTSRTLLLHLERELSTALPERFLLRGTPAPRLEFSGGDDPGQQLAYGIEHGTLVRRTAPRWSVPEASRPGVTVLEQVSRVELAAFDGTTWHDTWQAETPPTAVRILIAFTDGDTIGTVATIPTARPRRES
jgi:type II secretory pathway component PulJ